MAEALGQRAIFALSELSVAGICPKLQELEIDDIPSETECFTPEMALVYFIAGRRATNLKGGGGEGGTQNPSCAAPFKPIREDSV